MQEKNPHSGIVIRHTCEETRDRETIALRKWRESRKNRSDTLLRHTTIRMVFGKRLDRHWMDIYCPDEPGMVTKKDPRWLAAIKALTQ
jgi:hypothetical protein